MGITQWELSVWDPLPLPSPPHPLHLTFKDHSLWQEKPTLFHFITHTHAHDLIRFFTFFLSCCLASDVLVMLSFSPLKVISTKSYQWRIFRYLSVENNSILKQIKFPCLPPILSDSVCWKCSQVLTSDLQQSHLEEPTKTAPKLS